MIRIGDKYVRGSAVDAITPSSSDPDNWSVVVIGNNFIHLNAPAAVVADRVETDEIVTAMSTQKISLPDFDGDPDA